MGIQFLQREQWIARPLPEVFAFFSDAENLDLITPPWLHFRVLRQTSREIKVGTLIDYKLEWHGMPIDWKSRIEEWQPPFRFADLQLKGPYRLWHHTHIFESLQGGTLIRDVVRFSVPFGAVGDLFAGWLVRRDVRRIFDYRARKIAEIFRDLPLTSQQARNCSN